MRLLPVLVLVLVLALGGALYWQHRASLPEEPLAEPLVQPEPAPAAPLTGDATAGGTLSLIHI